MSKRTRRLEARVEILEREVERLRVLIDVADKNQTHGVPWKVPAVAKPVWRVEGQYVYCEGEWVWCPGDAHV